jgi:hypothetical protein
VQPAYVVFRLPVNLLLTYIRSFLSVLVFHQVEPVIAQRIYNQIVGENQRTDIPPWANLSLILH